MARPTRIPTALDIVRGIERRFIAGQIKRGDLVFTVQHEADLPYHKAVYYAAKISVRAAAGHPADEVLA